jgi:O-antigen ligase
MFQSGLIGLFIVLLCYYKIYKKSYQLYEKGRDYGSRAMGSLVIAQLLSYLFVYANGLTTNIIWSTNPATVSFLSTVACNLVLLRDEKIRVKDKILKLKKDRPWIQG